MTQIEDTLVIRRVMDRGCKKAKKSWEYGAASEALLEFYDPEFSVFGANPFPKGELPIVSTDLASLDFVSQFIDVNSRILIGGDGSSGDPASIGVFAEMIASSDPSYRDACQRQSEAVLAAPRWPNGAISHREEYAALWADFVYMAPPFLAYHAVATNDLSLMQQAIEQCLLYGEVLGQDSSEPLHGAWRHIVGPQLEDLGIWATGNGWAAGGMTRVLATAKKWPRSSEWEDRHMKLQHLILGIINSAIEAGGRGTPPLLCNFLDDTTWFDDAGSTAMLSAVAYRMAILAPDLCEARHIKFAEQSREAVMAHVDRQTGRVSPTPQEGLPGWTVNEASAEGSSQGHSFVVMMHSAYRDWLNVQHARRSQGPSG
ncbi:hypothetical protein P7C71_g5353, partial [Lecanoromycetidae sp. Uapishka_2]